MKFMIQNSQKQEIKRKRKVAFILIQILQKKLKKLLEIENLLKKKLIKTIN